MYILGLLKSPHNDKLSAKGAHSRHIIPLSGATLIPKSSYPLENLSMPCSSFLIRSKRSVKTVYLKEKLKSALINNIKSRKVGNAINLLQISLSKNFMCSSKLLKFWKFGGFFKFSDIFTILTLWNLYLTKFYYSNITTRTAETKWEKPQRWRVESKQLVVNKHSLVRRFPR